MTLHLSRLFLVLGIAAVALGIFLLIDDVSPAYALPEYTTRTEEPCAACHVSAGGGGPRTLRGMLWTAEDRPDEVPIIENSLLAPGIFDPLELYDVACAGCHGRKGEGLSATPLTSYTLTEEFIRVVVERGVPRSGMPAYRGQLTEEQLVILVEFVRAMSDGEIVPPDSYPLGPIVERCGVTAATEVASLTLPDETAVCEIVRDASISQGN